MELEKLKSPWARIAADSKPGIVIYVVLWSSIIFPTGLHITDPTFAWGNLITLSTLSLFRAFSVYNFSERLDRRPTLAKTLLTLGIYLSAAQWGLLGSVVLFHPAYEIIRFPLILCLAGVCAGALPYFTSSIRFAMTFNSLCLIPGAITSFYCFYIEPYYITLGFLFCIHFIGMFVLGQSLHKIYALAVTNADTAEERANRYAKISYIDSLSQAKNRTYYDQYFPEIWRKASSLKSPISIAVVDIDHFKSVNDNFGHLMGDQCVMEVAKVLKKELRSEEDIICRFGGDEFVLILKNTDSYGAKNIAERLLKNVSSMKINSDIQLTVSVGVHSETPDTEDGFAAAFDKADEALYKAKKAGRNCVKFS